MKNAILQICEKLRGYSDDSEYFEVVKVCRNEAGNYVLEVKAVEPAREAADESNK